VRKLKTYYHEDKAKEQAAISEMEALMKRGQVNSPDALQGPTAYVPPGGISIQASGKSSTYTP
jgi:hypothetical protein